MSKEPAQQNEAWLDKLIAGVSAWQKLPYAPMEVEVMDIVTPAAAKQAILTALRNEYQRGKKAGEIEALQLQTPTNEEGKESL